MDQKRCREERKDIDQGLLSTIPVNHWSSPNTKSIFTCCRKGGTKKLYKGIGGLCEPRLVEGKDKRMRTENY